MEFTPSIDAVFTIWFQFFQDIFAESVFENIKNLEIRFIYYFYLKYMAEGLIWRTV